MNGSEIFIIESRQVKGELRNLIMYYDGTVCKFAYEETGISAAPTLPIDLISAADLSWESMLATMPSPTATGEYDNSTNSLTFTKN